MLTVLVRSLCSKCNQSADVLAGCHRRQPYSNASLSRQCPLLLQRHSVMYLLRCGFAFFLVFLKEVISNELSKGCHQPKHDTDWTSDDTPVSSNTSLLGWLNAVQTDHTSFPRILRFLWEDVGDGNTLCSSFFSERGKGLCIVISTWSWHESCVVFRLVFSLLSFVLAKQIFENWSGTAPCPILSDYSKTLWTTSRIASPSVWQVRTGILSSPYNKSRTVSLHSPLPLVFHLSKSHLHLLCQSRAPGDQSGRQRYTVITTRSQVSRGKEVVKPVHGVSYIYPLFFTVFKWDTGTAAPSSVVSLSGCW